MIFLRTPWAILVCKGILALRVLRKQTKEGILTMALQWTSSDGYHRQMQFQIFLMCQWSLAARINYHEVSGKTTKIINA